MLSHNKMSLLGNYLIHQVKKVGLDDERCRCLDPCICFFAKDM